MPLTRLSKKFRGYLWRLHNRLHRGIGPFHFYPAFSNLGCYGIRLGSFYLDVYPMNTSTWDDGIGLFLACPLGRVWLTSYHVRWETALSHGYVNQRSYGRRVSNG